MKTPAKVKKDDGPKRDAREMTALDHAKLHFQHLTMGNVATHKAMSNLRAHHVSKAKQHLEEAKRMAKDQTHLLEVFHEAGQSHLNHLNKGIRSIKSSLKKAYTIRKG